MKIFRSVFSKLTGFLKWFQNASLKKKILTVIAAGAVVLLVSVPLLSGKQQGQVTTDTVKRATVVDTVSESGNVQSNQLTVYSVSSGVIEDLYVENGQLVNKGDNLFKVKSTASDQDKASAYANYLSAQENLNSAQSTAHSLRSQMYTAWDTFYNLSTNSTYTNGDGSPNSTNRESAAFITSQENWLADESKYKDQQTAVNQAQAALNSSWLSYQATQDIVITAQVGGTISNVSYSVGDQVTAAMNTSGSNTNTSASPVLVIGTASENIVKIQINEVDINKIKVGQKATITLNAIKDKTLSGEVTRVDNYGTDTSGVITYNVYVKIADSENQIKPQMSAVVTIETTKHENALVVPNSAVKPYKGGKAVQVRDTSKPGNQLKYVQVKTGIKGTNETEILEGVAEGMEVVTGTSTSSTSTSSQSKGGLMGGPPG
ncbi:MAG TPA: efflux RND transporter periplasmic adaptor subunit [Patescibacteria group bacterium]|nr:efflux RND transporter periplasmic adaptor subunit [Patescibacteria group bacterium]